MDNPLAPSGIRYPMATPNTIAHMICATRLVRSTTRVNEENIISQKICKRDPRKYHEVLPLNNPPVSSPQKQNPRSRRLRGFKNKSLTMTYFHTGIRTIIGAKSFH
ncbi:hypothetical protein ABE501_20540, partial [Comamonas testosteroni]